VEIVYNLIGNILLLANAMSFYMLFGLLIAGVLKQIISDDFIVKHLGKNKISSVVKATLLGIPMPVCSCSVIPLAKSLQKQGASKGAVQSFLISTPITGADSILATYSFFGVVFTIFRVVTSIFIAIFAGLLQNYFDIKDEKNIQNTMQTCCSSNCSSSHKKEDEKFSIQKSFYYAFVTLFKDIYKSLFVGLVLGALFTTFIPKELIEPFFQNQFLTYFTILLISMPLYVCATASLPIAVSFLLSGASGGAVFIFLSAGPATNSVTMGVVASMFGKKSLFLYLGSISVLSVIFGYIFDTFFANLEFFSIIGHNEHLSTIDTISTIILFGLMIFYTIRKKNVSM
jgi:uncharacterized membrane protein YraQ (UPF0718 family)